MYLVPEVALAVAAGPVGVGVGSGAGGVRRGWGWRDVKHQLAVFAIDYFQLFGRYRGTAGGYPVDGVHGVCESFRARL